MKNIPVNYLKYSRLSIEKYYFLGENVPPFHQKRTSVLLKTYLRFMKKQYTNLFKDIFLLF